MITPPTTQNSLTVRFTHTAQSCHIHSQISINVCPTLIELSEHIYLRLWQVYKHSVLYLQGMIHPLPKLIAELFARPAVFLQQEPVG